MSFCFCFIPEKYIAQNIVLRLWYTPLANIIIIIIVIVVGIRITRQMPDPLASSYPHYEDHRLMLIILSIATFWNSLETFLTWFGFVRAAMHQPTTHIHTHACVLNDYTSFREKNISSWQWCHENRFHSFIAIIIKSTKKHDHCAASNNYWWDNFGGFAIIVVVIIVVAHLVMTFKRNDTIIHELPTVNHVVVIIIKWVFGAMHHHSHPEIGFHISIIVKRNVKMLYKLRRYMGHVLTLGYRYGSHGQENRILYLHHVLKLGIFGENCFSFAIVGEKFLLAWCGRMMGNSNEKHIVFKWISVI